MEGSKDKTGPEPTQHSGLAWKTENHRLAGHHPVLLWKEENKSGDGSADASISSFPIFTTCSGSEQYPNIPRLPSNCTPQRESKTLILEVEQVKHTHCFIGTNLLKLSDFSQSHSQMTATGKTNGWHPGLSAKGADAVLVIQSRGDLVMAKHHSRATCHRKDTFNPCSN